MPNCFSLSRKSDMQAGPVKLTLIDEEMCAHFAVACHETRWHAQWYDIIGFNLAMGEGFQTQRIGFEQYKLEYPKEVKEWEHLIEILDWLEENFTSDAWCEIGRRA